MKETTRTSTQNSAFALVKELTEQVAKQLVSQQSLADSEVAVRVVGEFSSGKTRVIRELFQEYIPEALLPISSGEVQTRLPLEITFAEQPSLSLVKGTFGYKNRTVEKTLTHFPPREELINYVQQEYSLHLTLPHEKFILQHGDGFSEDNAPARFCLIDTLGWNSEDGIDLDSEEYFSEDWENLALIYVTKAIRIDSQFNRDMLTKLIESFEYGNLRPIRKTLPVICIITACSQHEKDSHKKRMQKYLDALMEERGIVQEKYPIQIITVEFDSMDADEKDLFRQKVWEAILLDNPSQAIEENAMTCALQNWPEQWNLQPYVKTSLMEYNRFKYALERAIHEGKYIKNMTRLRLDGLSVVDMRERLLQMWLRQLNHEDIQQSLAIQEVTLPEEHPVFPWWTQYWLPRRKAVLQSQKYFFESMHDAIMDFTEDVQDLDVYFTERVSKAFFQAYIATHNAFGQLCQVVLEWEDSRDTATFLGTLFSLSFIEAYYTDSAHKAQQNT